MSGELDGVKMMLARVWNLSPRDRVRQDAAPVAALYRDMGHQAAERVLIRAMGEMAMVLAGLADQVRRHDLTDVCAQMRRLNRIAKPLGMVTLCTVAVDVQNCLERGDATSFAAVWARLLRVGQTALALSPDQANLLTCPPNG